jgi:hypothetical protein
VIRLCFAWQILIRRKILRKLGKTVSVARRCRLSCYSIFVMRQTRRCKHLDVLRIFIVTKTPRVIQGPLRSKDGFCLAFQRAWPVDPVERTVIPKRHR